MLESTQFVLDVGCYLAACILALVVLIGADLYVRRRRHERPDAKGNSGLLLSEGMHWLARGFFGVTIFMLVLVPIAVICVCFALGPLVAVFEGWSAVSGIDFLMTCLLALESPLTALVPESAMGRIAAYFINLWGLVIITAAMGIVAQMSLITSFADLMPGTLKGFLLFALVHIPAALTLVAVLTGGSIALAEAWSFADGFYYMAGAIAGVPLTDVAPQTALGCLVEVICTCFELSVGGAIIGIIGAAPLTVQVMQFVEGGHADDGGDTSSGDGATDATDPAGAKGADGANGGDGGDVPSGDAALVVGVEDEGKQPAPAEETDVGKERARLERELAEAQEEVKLLGEALHKLPPVTAQETVEIHLLPPGSARRLQL